MAGEVVSNLSNVLGSLPPTWTSWVRGILIFFGVVSFFFVAYLVYMIITIVLSIKRAKRLKAIEEKIDKIYKKIVKKSN